MHLQENDTLRLTGWIHPGHASIALDGLSLLIVGYVAANEMLVRVRIVAACGHGCPYDADHRINRTFGAWLDLSGVVCANSIVHQAPGLDRLCNLEVAAISISRRSDALPQRFTRTYVPLRTLTAHFSPTQPRPAAAMPASATRLDGEIWRWPNAGRAARKLTHPTLGN